MITSVNNSEIKKMVELKQPKNRKETKTFLVEGEHLVTEALAQNVVIKIFTIDESLQGELVSEAVMKKLCNTKSAVRQIALCKILEKKEISDNILILDGIQDPGNMGALMRSAVAFGFDTLFIADGSVDIYNDKVIRSSQGAIFKLNFLFGDAVEFIKKISATHQVYGTDVVNGIDLNNIIPAKKIAFVLGNEGNGVSKSVKDVIEKNIYIKMNNTESLNVSVAGSIIMYELRKQ